MSDLPNGWTRATLDAISDVLDFEREPINSSDRNSRITGKNEADLYPYYGATGQVGFIDSFRSEGQRVLLGEDAAPFLDPAKDKAYLAHGRFWVNNHAHVLAGAVGLIDNKFLCHQLNTVDYRPFVTGSTRLKLTSSAMKQIPMVVAPAAEQTRIVEKLEELLSDLDAGVAELKVAQKKLGQYRQSLLKAAVEGALTADWRAARAPLPPRGGGVGGEGANTPATEDDPWFQARARELRQQQTPDEHALWQQLRAKRFSGYKFRRQQVLGRFIVDFVCFAKRLIVELDGGQHTEAVDYDNHRDTWLEQQGFRVLRFWNNEWSKQPEAVLESIWQALQQEPPLPNPSPARGEGLFEPESGAQLLQRILTERRARWEAKQLAKFKEQGKTPPKDWQKKYPEPVQPDTTGLSALPEGWVWASVDQLSESVRNGISKTPNTDGRGFPIFKINAVRPMAVNFTAIKHIELDESEAADYWVEVGDVLATRYNGSVDLLGVFGMVRTVPHRTLHPDKLIRMKSLLGVQLGAWLEVCGNVGVSRSHLVSRVKTTAGQTGISGEDLKKTPIPLPPFVEQEATLTGLEERLQAINELEAPTELGLKQSTAQRQNILRAAFSGQLVPQDPNDEPASVLLARIRAERAEREAVKKPRGRKAKERACRSN